jgi:hypothetical protein
MALGHRCLTLFQFGIVGSTALLAPGCRPDRPPPPEKADTGTAPADSLVLSDPHGIEIWFTLARTARGSDGKQCVERGLEIRRGGTRVPVPLLYTGETPTLLNDTTMRAMLWTQCKPLDGYLVDLRTGRPVRDRTERD